MGREQIARYRYLATNDDESSCACCGRKDLKQVVWLAELGPDGEAIDDGEPYGTTCAAHLLLGRHPKDRKPKLSQAKEALAAAELANRREAVHEALKLIAPAPVMQTNEHGVRVAVVGDVVWAGVGSGTSYDKGARDHAVIRWFAVQAFEIYKSWGCATIDRASMFDTAFVGRREQMKVR